jgi:hypothetical protein
MYKNLGDAHRGGLRNTSLLYPPNAYSVREGLIETIIAKLPIETNKIRFCRTI